MQTEFEVNPFDGFYAQLEERPDCWRVLVEVRGDGVAVEAHVVHTLGKDEHTAGEADRLLCLVQALCRYLNAGGDHGDARLVCDFMSSAFSEYSVTFPAPWRVFAAIQRVPEPTIVLTNDDTQEAIVVKEGLYSEKMTIRGLYDQVTGD